MKTAFLFTLFMSILGASYAQWTNNGNGSYGLTSGVANIGTAAAPLSGTGLTINTTGGGIIIGGAAASWLGGDITISRTNSGNYLWRSPNITLNDIATNTSSTIQSYQGNLQFFTGGSPGAGAQNFCILSNGNVGVATTIPVSTFQVSNASSSFSAGAANVANLNNGTSYIGFNATRSPATPTPAYPWTCNTNGTYDGGGVIFGDIYGNINFAAIPSNNGSAYAGYNDASIAAMVTFQITPAGVTHAKQIVVSLTSWPDYVFKPKYHLPSLTDIKTYIDINHHLPEIPSQQQIAKDGLNLGDMNKALVKKVEELTLYLIEKDKQLKNQEERLNKIEKQLETLSQK